MLQRKCPKCKKGIMSDLYTFQGWGRDGTYICDTCGHLKNIYEGPTIGPYIFFIIFEIAIFSMESWISLLEYTIYGAFLALFIYRIYRAQMRDSYISHSYPILGNAPDNFIPNSIQEDKLHIEMNQREKSATVIKYSIATFLVLSYSIILYTDRAPLDIWDYLGYVTIIIVLPLWLILTKFD